MTGRYWQYGPCPLCGSCFPGKALYRFAISSVSTPVPAPEDCGVLRVIRCPGCGLSYLYPRPIETAMSVIYSNSAYFGARSPGGYDDYFEQEVALRRTFRRFLTTLGRRGLTGGALADVGCGPGYLLDTARPFFRKRMGTDMCMEIAEKGAALCDGVVCGGPGELSMTGERFDLVTSIGVLEHLYEPVGFLRRCGNLTKRGGGDCPRDAGHERFLEAVHGQAMAFVQDP